MVEFTYCAEYIVGKITIGFFFLAIESNSQRNLDARTRITVVDVANVDNNLFCVACYHQIES